MARTPTGAGAGQVETFMVSAGPYRAAHTCSKAPCRCGGMGAAAGSTGPGAIVGAALALLLAASPGGPAFAGGAHGVTQPSRLFAQHTPEPAFGADPIAPPLASRSGGHAGPAAASVDRDMEALIAATRAAASTAITTADSMGMANDRLTGILSRVDRIEQRVRRQDHGGSRPGSGLHNSGWR